jgi:hypothetical protein
MMHGMKGKNIIKEYSKENFVRPKKVGNERLRKLAHFRLSLMIKKRNYQKMNGKIIKR